MKCAQKIPQGYGPMRPLAPGAPGMQPACAVSHASRGRVCHRIGKAIDVSGTGSSTLCDHATSLM